MTSFDTIRERFATRGKQSGLVGVLALILCVILGGVHAGWEQFFHSYLFAYVFWVSIPLGCVAILMMHHMTSGWWGFPIRRILEAGSRTLYVMALLFIPVCLGLPHIYAWARSTWVQDSILRYKHPYLNMPDFIIRAIIYFAVWLVFVYFLNSWSREQDATGDLRLKVKMERLSAPGLVAWAFVVTFASVDWVMSLEAHWFSTIYGMIFIVVDALAGLSFAICCLRRFWDVEPINGSIEARQFNDLGNLMLTFTLLWAYLSFDQFLIIWSGNLKDEITWYTQRVYGPWGPVAVALLLLHFFVPFFCLLQRPFKRRLPLLAGLAAWMILMTLLDVYWLVVPAYKTVHPRFYLTDALAIIGIGGVWFSLFARELCRMPILPLHDPRFVGARALGHQHGD